MSRKLFGLGIGVALVLGTASGVSAQDMTLGLKGGVAVADLSIDEPGFPSPDLNTRSGLALGAFLDIGLGGVFSVQPEVLYVQKGTKYIDVEDDVDVTIKLTYIEVPVLLKANLAPEAMGVKPSLYAGPVFSFESKCEIDGTDGTVAVTVDCNQADLFDGMEVETKSMDFGGVIGGGIEIPFGSAVVVGDARYTLGFTNINDTPMAMGVKIKNRTWAFLVGMGWPLN
jgi:hypothetical protein